MISKSALCNLCFFLCFFPYLNLFRQSAVEVQPICTVVAVLILMLFGCRVNRVTIAVGIFVALSIVYCFVSFEEGIGGWSVVLDFGAYLAPLLLFLGLRDCGPLLSPKALFGATVLHAGVGFLQEFHVFGWAEGLTAVVPRLSTGPLEGARGVSFLAPEPSYGAYILLLIVVSASYFYATRQITTRQLVFLSGLSFVMFIFNKSGTAFVLLFIYLLTLLVVQSRWLVLRHPFVIVVTWCVFTSSILFVILNAQNYEESNRYEQVIGEVSQLEHRSEFLTLTNLTEVAGARLISVAVGYAGLGEEYGLGHGVESGASESFRISEKLGVRWAALSAVGIPAFLDKPQSYASQVALDMGVPGLLVLGFLVSSALRPGRKYGAQRLRPQSARAVMVASLITGIFMILFDDTTALPVPWILLLFARWLREQGGFYTEVPLAQRRVSGRRIR